MFLFDLATTWGKSASCLSVTRSGVEPTKESVGVGATRRAERDTGLASGCAQTTRMGDMAAMAARYETLQEDEVIVPSGKGHTTASAAAMMKKWGKNGIPEGRSTWRPRGFLPRIAKLRTTSCVASAAASPSFVQLAPLCRASRSSAIAQHSRRDFVLASPLLP